MVRDSLKRLNIKITELADYLKISRPTMYKFIELYDSNRAKEINKNVKKLFEFIDENKLIEKRNVVNYILNNLNITKDIEDNKVSKKIEDISKYIINNPNSEKTFFIDMLTKVDFFDVIVHYLCEILPLLKNNENNKEKITKLLPYNQIINLYTVYKEKKEY